MRAKNSKLCEQQPLRKSGDEKPKADDLQVCQINNCYTARQMISGLDHSNFRQGIADWPAASQQFN